jgi:NADPH-dependent glutamate synthase beta subunit-like oxidoreductase
MRITRVDSMVYGQGSSYGRRFQKDLMVAVVGYGPTGMTLAALLGRLGHRVIVLERYSSWLSI